MRVDSYSITGSENGTQILLVIDGEAHAVSEHHPNFGQIRDSLLSNNMDLDASVLNPARAILDNFGEDMHIDVDTLYYRGRPLYTKLAQTIVDFYRKGRSVTNLVNFVRRLDENSSFHSREQLYEFLNRYDFRITDDGHFIAYKGLRKDMRSVHAGRGFVNGEEATGHLDNSIGNVLTMDRRDVADDPNHGCHQGLHAGTYSYAHSFGERVVEVLIDPADVVSVPNDSAFQKIRTCRYTVLQEVESEISPETYYDSRTLFLEWLDEHVQEDSQYDSFEELANEFIKSNEVLAYARELDYNHPYGTITREDIDILLVDEAVLDYISGESDEDF